MSEKIFWWTLFICLLIVVIFGHEKEEDVLCQTKEIKYGENFINDGLLDPLIEQISDYNDRIELKNFFAGSIRNVTSEIGKLAQVRFCGPMNIRQTRGAFGKVSGNFPGVSGIVKKMGGGIIKNGPKAVKLGGKILSNPAVRKVAGFSFTVAGIVLTVHQEVAIQNLQTAVVQLNEENGQMTEHIGKISRIVLKDKIKSIGSGIIQSIRSKGIQSVMQMDKPAYAVFYDVHCAAEKIIVKMCFRDDVIETEVADMFAIDLQFHGDINDVKSLDDIVQKSSTAKPRPNVGGIFSGYGVLAICIVCVAGPLVVGGIILCCRYRNRRSREAAAVRYVKNNDSTKQIFFGK